MHDSNIIFLHGWLFDRRIWQGLDKLFYNKFNTYMHDFTGYGGNLLSDINSQEYCDNIFTNAKAGTPYPKYFKASAVNLTSSLENDPYPNKALTISSEAKIKPRLAGIDNNKDNSNDLF